MINTLRRILDVLESPFGLARYALRILEMRNEVCPCCKYTALDQIKHRHPGMGGICGVGCCVVRGAAWFEYDDPRWRARFASKEGE